LEYLTYMQERVEIYWNYLRFFEYDLNKKIFYQMQDFFEDDPLESNLI
jgi:hypothetical protein